MTLPTPDEQVAEHLANGPDTWTVVGVLPRLWAVRRADGVTITSAKTKHEALEATRSGFHFQLWHKQTRWYAGEQVANWRPWADVKDERERLIERQAAMR